MENEVVTKEDLKAFGVFLIEEFKKIVKAENPVQRKYLRGNEVKILLKISQSTLMAMRNSGKLPFTKIGGIFYYKQEDITSLFG